MDKGGEEKGWREREVEREKEGGREEGRDRGRRERSREMYEGCNDIHKAEAEHVINKPSSPHQML